MVSAAPSILVEDLSVVRQRCEADRSVLRPLRTSDLLDPRKPSAYLKSDYYLVIGDSFSLSHEDGREDMQGEKLSGVFR
jgi:hypothetical protein